MFLRSRECPWRSLVTVQGVVHTRAGSGGETVCREEPGNMKQIASLSLALSAIWLAWSGHYEPLTLSLGAGSLVVVLALAVRMKLVDEEGLPLDLNYARLLAYMPWLALEVVKSNLDVARRILTPGAVPIAPRILRVRASQRSSVGQAIHANSITLTPGTISIDVEDGAILIHALHADAAAGAASGEMDRRCAALEVESA